MKTRRTLTAGAFLTVGGFVCTLTSFGTQLPQTHRTTSPRIQIGVQPRSGCANVQQREPVLLYDKTGSTFFESVHEQLSVYSDGLATYSRTDTLQRPGMVTVRTLSEETVQDLAETLAAAGADESCDEPMVITDVPLATVTVFGAPGTDVASHTFSYYDAASGASALVESILQEFIEAEIEGTR